MSFAWPSLSFCRIVPSFAMVVVIIASRGDDESIPSANHGDFYIYRTISSKLAGSNSNKRVLAAIMDSKQ